MSRKQEMDLGETMVATRRIERAMDGAFRDMDQMQESRGWAALGYVSWEECFDAEFRESVEDLLVVLETGHTGPPRRLEEFREALERYFTRPS